MKCLAFVYQVDYRRSFGWLTKVYVWKRSGPSNVILHRFCLTKGSTLTSQESHPRSVVYVSKPTRAIWRYLLSEIRALLCCCTAQWKEVVFKLATEQFGCKRNIVWQLFVDNFEGEWCADPSENFAIFVDNDSCTPHWPIFQNSDTMKMKYEWINVLIKLIQNIS